MGGEIGGAVEGEAVEVDPAEEGEGFAGGGDSSYGDDGEVGDDRLRDDVGGDGVGAEDLPGPDESGGQSGFALDLAQVEQPVEQPQRKQGPAGGEQDVGAGPEFLVEGKPGGPQVAGSEAEESGGEESGEALDGGDGVGWGLQWRGYGLGAEGGCPAHPKAGEEAEEGGGDGGEGREEAFGVADGLVEVAGVEVTLDEGDDVAVKPSDQVLVVVEQWDLVGGCACSGDGDEAEEQPVADEECGGEKGEGAGSLDAEEE